MKHLSRRRDRSPLTNDISRSSNTRRHIFCKKKKKRSRRRTRRRFPLPIAPSTPPLSSISVSSLNYPDVFFHSFPIKRISTRSDADFRAVLNYNTGYMGKRLICWGMSSLRWAILALGRVYVSLRRSKRFVIRWCRQRTMTLFGRVEITRTLLLVNAAILWSILQEQYAEINDGLVIRSNTCYLSFLFFSSFFESPGYKSKLVTST